MKTATTTKTAPGVKLHDHTPTRSGVSVSFLRNSKYQGWTFFGFDDEQTLESSLWTLTDCIVHARSMIRQAMADDLDAMTSEDVAS